MICVIQYVGLEGMAIDESSRANPGDLLKSYDPEAHDGQGAATFTDKLDEAMTFEDLTEAFRCIFRVPVKRPRRPDGKPNMPLRALTLDVVPVDKLMRGS
jgi:hypothetical protein